MTGPDFDAPKPRALSAQQADADGTDLHAGLAGLAGLVTASLGLDDLLGRVAAFAAQAVPGADGAGVTLLRADRSENQVQALAASHPFVTEIDQIQYVTVREGPCITAALEGRTVRSGSLGGEKLWPRFGPRAGRLGVHSALSVPLQLPGMTVGALNVYAHGKDVFDEHAERLSQLFAAPAAVAIHNAQGLAHALQLIAQLQTALASRRMIDQAIGISRSRAGGTSDEAFARLRRISQQEHIKLADLAQDIIDDAVRRTEARRGPVEASPLTGDPRAAPVTPRPGSPSSSEE